LTFAIDTYVWGTRALGRHVTAAAAYVLAVAALWLVARRLGLGHRAALLATLWFALHGAHSETLCWAKNRGELLAALFGLACLTACQIRRPVGMWLAVAFLLVAMGALESGMLYAAAALGAGLLALPRERSWRLRRGAMLLTLAAAFALAQTRLLSKGSERPNQPTIKLLVDRPAAALELAGRYSSMLLVPNRLCMDPTVGRGPTAQMLAALVLVLCVGALALRRGRGAYAAALLAASLALAAGVLVRDRPMAEHRAFAASAGLALCVALVVQRHAPRSRTAVAALLLATCAMAGLFVQRHFVWRSDARVWRDNVVKSPDSPKARMNYANVCADRKQFNRAFRNLSAGVAAHDAAAWQFNLQPPITIPRRILDAVRTKRGQPSASRQ